MKKFVEKLFLFFLLLLFIEQCISYGLRPYTNTFHGNPAVERKIEHLRETNTSYDAYYIGSSKTFRHIKPKVVDSVIYKSTGRSFNSFNLGAPATFSPETDAILFKLLNDPDLIASTSFIFLEISEIQKFGKQFPASEKSTYWIGYQELEWVVKTLVTDINMTNSLNENLSKMKNILDYVIGFVLNQYNIGSFSSFLGKTRFSESVGLQDKGYYSIELNLDETSDNDYKNELLSRNLELKSKPVLLKDLEKKTERLYNHSNLDLNEYYKERFSIAANACQKKGILLVPILPPRSANSYTIALFKNGFYSPSLDMNNPSHNGFFYLTDLSYDRIHLNQQGAQKYSLILGERIAAIMKNLSKTMPGITKR